MSDKNFETLPKGWENLYPIYNHIFNEIPRYDGGKTLIDRLIKEFGLKDRNELSSFTGLSLGTLATWQTRNTTPFELIIRVHLFTGISIPRLLFGIDEPAGIGLSNCPAVISMPKDLVKDELALIHKEFTSNGIVGTHITLYPVKNNLSLTQVNELIELIKSDSFLNNQNVFLSNMLDGQQGTDSIFLLAGKLHIKFIRQIQAQ